MDNRQLHKGDRVIKIVPRSDREEKQAKIRRHFRAMMILLADLEPEDYLDIAKRLKEKSLLTDQAA